MKPGVYFVRLGQVIKIGYSIDPVGRLASISNYWQKDAELVAHIPGPPSLEAEIHEQFSFCSVGHETFLPNLDLERLMGENAIKIVRKIYEKRGPQHSRRKVPSVLMTPKRIAQVGALLNSGMSGPKVAAKLKISTGSIYAHWKQVGPHKFVRKRKTK